MTLFSRILPLVLLALMLVGCAHRPEIRDRRVLVMDFQDATSTGTQTDRGGSLADMLTAELVNYPRITVTERQDLHALTGGRDVRNTAWRDLGRRAGVDYVIVGSIAMLDANHIINARILSVETGQLVNGSSVTRACRRQEDIFPVMQAISRVLAGHLKVLAERHDAMALGRPRDEAVAPAVEVAP